MFKNKKRNSVKKETMLGYGLITVGTVVSAVSLTLVKESIERIKVSNKAIKENLKIKKEKEEKLYNEEN